MVHGSSPSAIRFGTEQRSLVSLVRNRLATGAACCEADPSKGGRWQLLGAALETRSIVLAHRNACEGRANEGARSAHAEILSLLDALIRVTNGDCTSTPEGRAAALSLVAAAEAALRRHDEALAAEAPSLIAATR